MTDIPIAEVRFVSGVHRLNGTLFGDPQMAAEAMVVHAATGVPHRFYRHFAAYAAGQGRAVLTYDYRDFGASAAGPAKASRATMADWGVRDQAAARAFLEEAVPGRPVHVVGHSLGGLCLPFQPGADRVARLTAVASGPVHLSDHPWPYRALALTHWFGHGAALVQTLGYLPAWAGLGADIPGTVFRQWRRWCTTPGFHIPDIGGAMPQPDWRAFTGEARHVAAADDDLCPPAAVWRGMDLHPAARASKVLLEPAAFGLRRIGHIRAFAPECRAVWPAILA